MNLLPYLILIATSVMSFILCSLVIVMTAGHFAKDKKRITIRPSAVWRKSILPAVLVETAAVCAGFYFLFLLRLDLEGLGSMGMIPMDLFIFLTSETGSLLQMVVSCVVCVILVFLLQRRFGFRKCGMSAPVVESFVYLLSFAAALIFLSLVIVLQPVSNF